MDELILAYENDDLELFAKSWKTSIITSKFIFFIKSEEHANFIISNNFTISESLNDSISVAMSEIPNLIEFLRTFNLTLSTIDDLYIYGELSIDGIELLLQHYPILTYNKWLYHTEVLNNFELFKSIYEKLAYQEQQAFINNFKNIIEDIDPLIIDYFFQQNYDIYELLDNLCYDDEYDTISEDRDLIMSWAINSKNLIILIQLYSDKLPELYDLLLEFDIKLSDLKKSTRLNWKLIKYILNNLVLSEQEFKELFTKFKISFYDVDAKISEILEPYIDRIITLKLDEFLFDEFIIDCRIDLIIWLSQFASNSYIRTKLYFIDTKENFKLLLENNLIDLNLCLDNKNWLNFQRYISVSKYLIKQGVKITLNGKYMILQGFNIKLLKYHTAEDLEACFLSKKEEIIKNMEFYLNTTTDLKFYYAKYQDLVLYENPEITELMQNFN